MMKNVDKRKKVYYDYDIIKNLKRRKQKWEKK